MPGSFGLDDAPGVLAGRRRPGRRVAPSWSANATKGSLSGRADCMISPHGAAGGEPGRARSAECACHAANYTVHHAHPIHRSASRPSRPTCLPTSCEGVSSSVLELRRTSTTDDHRLVLPKTPQALGDWSGARGRAGCEVSAIRSPLSSGVSPLLSGCCFHERDAHIPRARLHRPESEHDQDGPRRHRSRRDAVDSGPVGYDGRQSDVGVQAVVHVPFVSMRVRICGPLRRGARMSPRALVLIFKDLLSRLRVLVRQSDSTN